MAAEFLNRDDAKTDTTIPGNIPGIVSASNMYLWIYYLLISSLIPKALKAR